MTDASTSPSTVPLSERITLKRAKSLALINSDKTPRLVPPSGGFSEQIKRRLSDIQKHTPKLYPLFFRVYAGQSGMAESVKAKCLDCSCWQIAEITNCTVFTCPLWAHRPYQEKRAK
jgi:hypothetical protein